MQRKLHMSAIGVAPGSAVPCCSNSSMQLQITAVGMDFIVETCAMAPPTSSKTVVQWFTAAPKSATFKQYQSWRDLAGSSLNCIPYLQEHLQMAECPSVRLCTLKIAFHWRMQIESICSAADIDTGMYKAERARNCHVHVCAFSVRCELPSSRREDEPHVPGF